MAQPPGDLVIRPEPLTSPRAIAFIEALNAELNRRYPEDGANHFGLTANEVSAGRGVFLVALEAGTPLGCGAVRVLDGERAEIKRMYVVPSGRKRGIGRAILEALEAQARALGRTRLVLEAGDRQPEALALYARHGFRPVAPWGEYVDSPLSVCLGKTLE